MADSQPTYKVTVIAKLLNVTERRIQQLAKDGIIPKPEKGKYDLVGCVQGYIRYLQNCASGKQGAAIDSHVERARLLKAKADKTEIEVDTLKSTLLPADEVERVWCTMLSAFRAKMLALPTKAAQLILPLKEYQQIRNVLTEQVHEALTELASHESSQFIQADREVFSSPETAAKADSESVGGQAPETKRGSKRRTRKMEN